MGFLKIWTKHNDSDLELKKLKNLQLKYLHAYVKVITAYNIYKSYQALNK